MIYKLAGGDFVKMEEVGKRRFIEGLNHLAFLRETNK
jgi:hypothetical protein